MTNIQKSLHIGMFTDTYTPQINGVVTSVRGLSYTLRELGHRVTIIAPSHPEQVEEEGVFRLRAVDYLPIPEQRMILPPSPRKLQKMVNMRFDLIHTHGAFTVPLVGLTLAKALDIPLVHTYHTRMRDYIHYYPWYPYISALSEPHRWYMTPQISSSIRRRLDRNTMRVSGQFDTWFANRCTHLITPTKIIADEMKDMGVLPPISVIPNGINLKALRTPQTDPFIALDIPKGQRLLTVSRLGREKSVDILIDRLKLILAQRSDVHLVILGDGPDRPLLEAQAQRLGITQHVHFMGYVLPQQVGAFYQHADVFVFASVTETQGMVALEAAACGLPVVARAEGGIANSVAHGVAGYLVPPQDAETFVQHVLELLAPDIHAQFSASARLWADTGSLETMAQHVLISYQKALSTLEDQVRPSP